MLFLDQETKLRYLENKINQILDNIIATKNNIVHPSMLTLEELDIYQIDFHKLKLLRAGVTKYKDQYLVFAVKIPRSYIVAELQMIKAVPNSENFEINGAEELIVVLNGRSYQYNENMSVKELKLSKNCIVENKCILTYNNVTSIEEIDDETLLMKNMYNDYVWQNCDDRRINLTGNYLINFNNCSIGIRNKKFYNRKITIMDKYIYPNNDVKHNHVKPIDFNKIVMENMKNIKEIHELKYHRNVIYGSNMTVIILVVLSVLGFIAFNCWKNKGRKIQIINSTKPETSDLKRGGVTHLTTQRNESEVKTSPDQSDTINIPMKAKPMAW